VRSVSAAVKELTGLNHRLNRLADETALAAGRLSPKGARDSDWRKLVNDMEERQASAARALDLFRERMAAIPLADRQNAFASIPSFQWRAYQELREGIESRFLVGASRAQRASLQGTLPGSGLEAPRVPTRSVAGIRFAEPSNWQFDNGTLTLGEGTEIVAAPQGGEFLLAGTHVRLPDGTELESGRLQFEAGQIVLEEDARVRGCCRVAEVHGTGRRVR